MDFVTTTAFYPGKSREYKRPPKRVLLEEYRAAELESALYTEAKTRIDEIERQTRKSIEKIEGRMEVVFGSALVIITVLFAVIAIFTTFGKETVVPVWPNLGLVMSIFALALAFLAYRKSRAPK